MTFTVGQRVRIQQQRPGGRVAVHGHGTVIKVGLHRIDLADGSRWRARDGYEWGSKLERGVGRSHQRQIAAEET